MNRKKYKSKYSKYRFPIYKPEVHYMTTDYWGESDEHGIVNTIIEHFYWDNVDEENWDSTSGEYPQSTFPNMSREQFIKYLSKLPTKVKDNKINKVLKTQNKDE
jgi:acyl carrier protein phosphodiesterase